MSDPHDTTSTTPPVSGAGSARGRFDRRTMLKWSIRLGAGAFALAFALPALALKTLQLEQKTIAAGDTLVYAGGARLGQPVQAADLRPGEGVQAFPAGKADNQNTLVEVVRIGAGPGAEGLRAYSAICTHLGCVVFAGLDEQGRIACPCHGSKYDPRDHARVLAGPSPRPLPAVPLRVTPDGALAAGGPPDGPIGPQ